MVIVKKLVEWGLAGETEVLGENLPHHHFVHHKSHMTRLDKGGQGPISGCCAIEEEEEEEEF
jgi:hypothetical protein